MDKLKLNIRVKEIIIEALNLEIKVTDIDDNTPLFGTDEEPGLFNNSLCVLEVTSALVGEFDIDPSCFNEKSFETIQTLTDSILKQINKNQ